MGDRLTVVASAATRARAGTGSMFYMYVLKSEKNGRHYTGSTDDLKRRVQEHNSGIGGRFTSNNRPYQLVYYEAYISYDLARKAGKFYKTGIGREVLKGKLST